MRTPKTNKLYINGLFPRTESGRAFPFPSSHGGTYANLCDATRKDLRGAVDAARAAFDGWSGKSAYHRGQILYRMAEMISARRSEFVETLQEVAALSEAEAVSEAAAAEDAFIYFAGFTDKFQQLIGSVNPVSGPHHNFTTAEPVGVVGYLPDPSLGFAAFCGRLAATIGAGNTMIALLPGLLGPLLAPLAEVFATSDLPAGVVNLLTESKNDLLKHLASHMEVQAVVLDENFAWQEARKLGVDNLKRVIGPRRDLLQLATVLDTVEYKTVWHPIGV